MTANPPRIPIEALLEHEEFVRRLSARLVRDSAMADDLAQEAWLKALRSPPKHASSLRGWFSRVVRSRRDSMLKSSRIEGAEPTEALPASAPSPADRLLERAIADDLRSALDKLPEHYRTVILLRFYEGLRPGEISERLRVPLETVKTRIKRGLARLRDGLDDEYGGDRQGWASALLGWAAGIPKEQPRIGAASWVAAASVILGASTLVVAVTGERSSSEMAARSATVETPSPLRTGTDSRGRTALEPRDSHSAPAELEVAVLWDDDSRPAEAIPVLFEHERSPERSEITDSEGRLRLSDLDPGIWTVRGPSGEARRVLVKGPATTVIELRLPRGRTLVGSTLHPDRTPLAGATVEISWPGRPTSTMRTVESDEEGRFRIAHVDARSWIGARSEDYLLPGKYLLDLLWTSEDPSGAAEATLRFFQPNRPLEGVVRDESGRPVAGARVQVRPRSRSPVVQTRHGRFFHSTPPPAVRTDETGTFVIPGVRDGNHLLEARAAGRITSVVPISAPSVAQPVEITLRRGATLAGRVRWEDGVPAAGATIELDVTGRRSYRTTADDAGEYRLGGLEPTLLGARAMADEGDRAGGASTVLDARAGGELDWSPTLGSSGVVEGVVLDGGRGVPDQTVRIEPEEDLSLFGIETLFVDRGGFRETITDAAGRFRFSGCFSGPYRVAVLDQGPHPWILERAVLSDGDPVVLRASDGIPPSSRIIGRVVLDDGSAPRSGRLALSSETLLTRIIVELDSEGRFESPELPPGGYDLVLLARGTLARALGGIVLADEDLDLGDLAVPSLGKIELDIEKPPGLPGNETRVEFYRGDRAVYWAAERTGSTPDVVWREGGVSLPAVPPGEYTIEVRRGGCGSAVRRFQVEAGRTHVGSITLRPAVTDGIELTLRPSLAGMADARVEVYDASGNPCMPLPWIGGLSPGRSIQLDLLLPAGDYEARVIVDSYRLEEGGGRHRSTGATPFWVDEAPSRPVVVVDLEAPQGPVVSED